MKDCFWGRKAPATDGTIQRGQNIRNTPFFDLSRRTLELRLLTALVVWILAVACSRADIVVLINGDVIEGLVTKQDESTIVLKHRDLGQIEISKDRIKSSTIGAPDATVVLAGGDTIKGKLVERSDFAIILENPDLGRVEIPRERIDSLKIKSREFKMETKEGWFDKEMRWLNARTSRLGEKGWKASFDLSLDSATGNTDEQATRFGGHVKRSLPDLRLALDMSYLP